MKKRLSVTLILLFAVLLTSCNREAAPPPNTSDPPTAAPTGVTSGRDSTTPEEPGDDTTAPTPTVFMNERTYSIAVAWYQTSIDICYQPPLSDGRILVANQENYTDRENARTLIYDTKTGEETEIDIFAQDPQIYGEHIYYAYHDVSVDADGMYDVGGDDQRQLIKRNIETGEESIIYEVEEIGAVIAPAMHMSGSYLAWYEHSSDAEHILGDGGETVGIYGDAVVFDLQTEKIVYREEHTAAFSPYFPPYLCGGEKVILTVDGEDGYNVKVVDFLNGGTIYEHHAAEVPICVEYDNQRFACMLRSGDIDVWNTVNGEKINSIAVNLETGGFSEMRILDGRFLVYGKPTEVFVMDLNTGEQVYSGYNDNIILDESDYPYRYIHHGSFTVNKESKQVLYRCTDRGEEGAVSIVVLSFTEGAA